MGRPCERAHGHAHARARPKVGSGWVSPQAGGIRGQKHMPVESCWSERGQKNRQMHQSSTRRNSSCHQNQVSKAVEALRVTSDRAKKRLFLLCKPHLRLAARGSSLRLRSEGGVARSEGLMRRAFAKWYCAWTPARPHRPPALALAPRRTPPPIRMPRVPRWWRC